MKQKRHPLGIFARSAFAFAVVTAVFCGLTPTLYSADSQAATPASKIDSAPSPTNAVPLKAKSPKPKQAVVKKQLTGAELYSMHCNRCHPERYPTERTAAQWKTIMLHMQVRASIPGNQAKLILQYLQENSGR